MRVAVYYNNHDVRVEEQERPTIGPDEILVEAAICGICGSDVMEWYRIKQAPRILGHEMCGKIVAIGANVSGRVLGERVFVSHHVPCNNCRYCERGNHTACPTLHSTNFDPGGFAEYIRVPAINLACGIYPIPDNMSYLTASFIEPLACIARAHRIAPLPPKSAYAILGCGLSGLLHIRLAKHRGASLIVATDPSPYRRKRALASGADLALAPDADLAAAIKERNSGYLADCTIVATGAKAAATGALNITERGGTIIYFAVPPEGTMLPIPINDFWRQEMTIQTSYGAAPEDLSAALLLLQEKQFAVLDLVTHRLPLAEAQAGFALVAAAGESMKVVLEMNNHQTT